MGLCPLPSVCVEEGRHGREKTAVKTIFFSRAANKETRMRYAKVNMG